MMEYKGYVAEVEFDDSVEKMESSPGSCINN